MAIYSCGSGGSRSLPNNSFKPNLLRYTKAMAEKACHGFASTTQVGLTQALGASSFLGVGHNAPSRIGPLRRQVFSIAGHARVHVVVVLGFGRSAACGHDVQTSGARFGKVRQIVSRGAHGYRRASY